MKLWQRKEKYTLRSCPYCGNGLFPHSTHFLDVYCCYEETCRGYFFLDDGVVLPRPNIEYITVYPAQAKRGWETLWDA